MYFPAFFPSVRPFDGRTATLGGGPVELPVMPTGREREIPLDLSIKTVHRQPADSSASDAEDFLLLEHRKLMGGFAGLGRPLLDPAMFRLPYRLENGASYSALPPFCATGAHPMMNSLLQRERCLSEAVHRVPMMISVPLQAGPFLDPSALSLHLRTQREAATRSLYASSLPGYSLFSSSEFLPSESRRHDEKGAFTSVRQGDKAFLSNQLDAARYVEHLHHMREQQHQQVKCTAVCCAPMPGLSQTPSSSCACCLQGPSPLCSGSRAAASLKDSKVCNTGIMMPSALSLGLQPPRAPANIPVSPFCGGDTIPPLYMPSTMWSPGLQPPVSLSSKPAAPVCSPASDKKKKDNGVSSPRTAKDYPDNKLFVPKMVDLTTRVKEDVIVIDDHPPLVSITEPLSTNFKTVFSETSKRSSMSTEVEGLPSKMPRLEAVRHSVVDVLADSRSPTGPPPLLPAVPKVEPETSDNSYDPAKLVVRLPKKMHSSIPLLNGIPCDPGYVAPSQSPALAEVGIETPNHPSLDEDDKTVLKNLLTSVQSPRDSPHKVMTKVRGSAMSKCPVKVSDDPAVADKRQRAFDLYSDLSELDQQDHISRKTVRLRDIDNDMKPVKIKQEVPSYRDDSAIELRVEDAGDMSEAPELTPDDPKAKTKSHCRLLSDLCREDESEDGEKPLERRILSQLNLTWRQRRLLYTVRRRRFRSGLDMIASRRNHRKKVMPKMKISSDMVEEEDGEEVKVASESVSSGVPPEMKRLMVNKALGETSLHRAARQCYPDVVLYCLESKCCDVNARDNAGYTPLHECCSRGHLEIARVLLQYGADVNASAAGGIRPLHDAVENDHVEVVRLLLSYGADPTIATYSGLSPLKLVRSPLMSQFLRGFMADISGESDCPILPWHFHGSASCLDPVDVGFDVFDGVPSDSEVVKSDADAAAFLFEVSATPHLTTFRLPLPSSGSKAQCNYLRLRDVLQQINRTKKDFSDRFPHIEVIEVAKQEFDSTATCSQLGTKRESTTTNEGHTVSIVRLDNHIRAILGIETVTLR